MPISQSSKGKEFGEFVPAFFHEENNENLEDDSNDELEMPQNDESSKENRYEVGNATWKGKVFVRKNHKEWDESTSPRFHESKPVENEPPKKVKVSLFLFLRVVIGILI